MVYADSMKTRRVCIVGDTLFAETLGQMLGDAQAVEVVGFASTPEAALPVLEMQHPDAVIVAGVGQAPPAAVGQFLGVYPDLTIICTDLNTDEVRVISSQWVAARSDDLIKAIRHLPTRRKRRGHAAQRASNV
jgi:DNA-binding NarL/FixJ family response regulator